MTSPLIRDTFEMMIVVGVGGTLVSAIRKLRRHEIEANICTTCGRPCSHAYPACTKCGTLHHSPALNDGHGKQSSPSSFGPLGPQP